MGQERLNNVMLLNTHHDATDSLDLVAVARDFVALNDYRRSILGTFSIIDYCTTGC